MKLEGEVMKRFRSIIAVVMAVMMVVGTVPTQTFAAPKKKAVTSVTITSPSTSKLVMKKGSTYQLKTKVAVTGKATKKVTFSSSNTRVATVSKTGKIKAVKAGKAIITVKSTFNKKKKDTVTVTVGTPVTKVTLNKKKVTANVGDKVALKATVSPKKATVNKVTFSSSKSSVASVSSKGVVTCKKAGTAIITAKSTDGTNKKATCTIVVKSTAAPTAAPTVAPTAAPTPTVTPTVAPTVTPAPTKAPDLSYDGYELKFEDNFNGTALDETNWNIEEHQPGWVNNEKQEYTKSSDNIYVADGNLVIQPIKTDNGNGTYSYTSGRVNTQGKRDYKYGMFEARAKVPAGQGYLPAFWMMPTNENLYGQWPKCGEIDIMEVLGSKTDTAYGTLHYGAPHEEKQGSYKLTDSNYADEYHTFTCEWEPGKISWYIDGYLYYTVNNWFSATEGQGEVAYPAPFDQPFYMILNLAVGGNWPGDPDDTTSFDQAFVIDYVKAYQKDSYDENVEKPVEEVVLRDPDANGNYINNGDFAEAENLDDDENWKFLLALGGVASATIENNAIKIESTNAGTADYSVQLVQANLPMQKGAKYKVTFDAYAAEGRTMKVGISAPDRGYKRYLDDTTVELTNTNQSFSYEFTMTGNDDANGRLEFNLGNQGSMATVTISNVKVKKIADPDPNAPVVKTILADGNHVYNGAFQEGAGRLAYWDITKNEESKVTVTNTNNIRRLQVEAANCSNETDIKLGQKDLALVASKKYEISFDAEVDEDRTIKVVVAGQEHEFDVTTTETNYQFKFETGSELDNKDIVFYLGKNGITYLDNVRLVEDTLIKNGSFDAGFAGYEPYVDSSANATYVVDSQHNDKAAAFTINNSGDAAWKIQLKQNNVVLEKGQWYRLSLDAKSSLDRKIMFAIQRDGSVHKNPDGSDDWTPYSGEKKIDITSEYDTYSIEFKMSCDTDLHSILSISLGTQTREAMTTQHEVCIDNIVLEKIEAPASQVVIDEEMLTNGTLTTNDDGWEVAITSPGAAATSVANGITYVISNVGDVDWHVQFKQGNLKLYKGQKYRLTFTASSTIARTIKVALLGPTIDHKWYGGEDIVLADNTPKNISFVFTMLEDTDLASALVVSMGKIDKVDTPTSSVTLSNFSLKAIDNDK